MRIFGLNNADAFVYLDALALVSAFYALFQTKETSVLIFPLQSIGNEPLIDFNDDILL
ncbi:hypothetical protein PTE_01508 [Photorhabdus khanii NC19]|uniref:Uncharacterized protein n=1 Tax=Photorhabdus khanii NC19 TaxID=1004151 RepID=W3V8P5_9GAMM|nr:hypothetical protein [Photorhabdus khanii]ETS32202.1 hypothetical protein PTE_01508 [Photorhabdus khanii NC19]